MCASSSSRFMLKTESLPGITAPVLCTTSPSAGEMTHVAEQVAIVGVAQFLADVDDVVARAGRRLFEAAPVDLVVVGADDVAVAHADHVRARP